MQKRLGLVTAALLASLGLVTANGSFNIYAAEGPTVKQAILVVSFGTTYADTRKVTTDAVTGKIQAAFPGYEVRQAFTSRIIIKTLADRDKIKIDTEKQALDRLKADGYDEVVVQPLHIEAGDEYAKLLKVVAEYEKAFTKITLGRPLLYYTGQEGEKPDDYLIAIKALRTQLPKLGKTAAVALLGHGGVNPANAAYAALQLKLEDAGCQNVFVFTVEGYPALDNLKLKLKQNKIKKVILAPFMLVAGDHARNDMAGAEPDSFQSQLRKAGYQVESRIQGLGENPAIQAIYVQHVKDAIDNKYQERGKDRPPIPVIE
jgi:sirohydrochlorin cobaltochelatase